jgi:nitrogen fixation/metabolism regulation signal transduction histidine kinase
MGAFLLARTMTRPIAEASRAAHRIASGELDVPIDHAGRTDELGALLAAMAVMRDNIRAMMEREVAAKHAAQNDLAVAIESAPAAMILIDGKGRVSVANSQALDFFADQADALVTGAPFSKKLAGAFADSNDEVRLHDGRWVKLNRRDVAASSPSPPISPRSRIAKRRWSPRAISPRPPAVRRPISSPT